MLTALTKYVKIVSQSNQSYLNFLNPTINDSGFLNFKNIKSIQGRDFKTSSGIFFINNSFSTSNIKKLLNLKLFNLVEQLKLCFNLKTHLTSKKIICWVLLVIRVLLSFWFSPILLLFKSVLTFFNIKKTLSHLYPRFKIETKHKILIGSVGFLFTGESDFLITNALCDYDTYISDDIVAPETEWVDHFREDVRGDEINPIVPWSFTNIITPGSFTNIFSDIDTTNGSRTGLGILEIPRSWFNQKITNDINILEITEYWFADRNLQGGLVERPTLVQDEEIPGPSLVGLNLDKIRSSAVPPLPQVNESTGSNLLSKLNLIFQNDSSTNLSDASTLHQVDTSKVYTTVDSSSINSSEEVKILPQVGISDTNTGSENPAQLVMETSESISDLGLSSSEQEAIERYLAKTINGSGDNTDFIKEISRSQTNNT